MRLFVVLLALLTIVSCQSSEEDVVIPDIEVSIHSSGITTTETGLILHNGVPFAGMITAEYENGVIKEHSLYYLGLKHGLSEIFYPSGSKRSQRTYIHGEHIGWHTNGQRKFHYNFVNGISEGTHYEWHSSGQMSKEFSYADGQPLGTQKVWRSDGKLRSNYIIHENGRKYGLIGIKRCANVDTENEKIDRITESTVK